MRDSINSGESKQQNRLKIKILFHAIESKISWKTDRLRTGGEICFLLTFDILECTRAYKELGQCLYNVNFVCVAVD